jgi:hypothetical protein
VQEKSSVGKLKKMVGKLKYKVLECWPYALKQHKASKLREQFRPMVFELPAIHSTEPPEAEIHMLCGKEQLDMGIWASWSLLRYLENAVLYVHSDGTLDERDMDLWRKIIASVVIVSKHEADVRAESAISEKYALLYAWRYNNWASAQLIDVHLFGKSARLIVMDSDVLCFKDPIELRYQLTVSEPAFHWNRDARSCYSASIGVLNSITGLKFPEALNAGFLLTPRFEKADFDYLERMITLINTKSDVDVTHFWSCQTYYAMCAARFPGSRPLPDSYAVTLGRTSGNTVVRHYVGIPRVRPRYFTEGIPNLLADLAKDDI